MKGDVRKAIIRETTFVPQAEVGGLSVCWWIGGVVLVFGTARVMVVLLVS